MNGCRLILDLDTHLMAFGRHERLNIVLGRFEYITNRNVLTDQIGLAELQVAEVGQVFDQVAQVQGAVKHGGSVIAGFALGFFLQKAGIAEDHAERGT